MQHRLSDWPLWLVEGLAEYCATPTTTKKGVVWDRLGTINALNMATLRELDNPASNQVDGVVRPTAIRREPRLTQTESLILKTRLTPTDYAQAWALTHYLAQKRGPDFWKFLKSMSQMPPLQPRTPEEQRSEFCKFFGDELAKLDKKVDDHVRKLSRQPGYDRLPYYAVMFVQPLGAGVIRRAVKVSQSPQVIQQWVQDIIDPQGGVHTWQAFPFLTRSQANLTAEEWMRSFW